MSRDLQGENRLLRRRLEAYLGQVRDNERKLRRFQRHELRLIGLHGLPELVRELLYPDRSEFRWDAVTLLLLDPEYEIRRILAERGTLPEEHPTLLFAAESGLVDQLFPASLFPLLGPYRPRYHGRLFAPALDRGCPPLRSVALLPLVRHGRLLGSLNIGSQNPDRFVQGVRTDFMEHLAAVVAICLENAVNLERLQRLGLTDTLTGVSNRRYFEQRLGEELERARRSGEPLSCLLVDVDHFKRVNDTHGHLVGDAVLREVATLLRDQLRASDVLARYGGEEFAVLLPRSDPRQAREVAERMRRAVAGGRFAGADGAPFPVTVSIGASTYEPARGSVPDGALLVGRADRALYEAKASGRNRVVSAERLEEAAGWPWAPSPRGRASDEVVQPAVQRHEHVRAVVGVDGLTRGPSR